jgi:site-specific DNA recombinase
MSEKRIRALGYVRVSTAHQADEGLSLEEQKRRVAAYIEGNGWEHVGTLTERGVSGAVPFADRPEFSRLLTMLPQGIDRVVIPKLDRLGRSTVDLLAAIERVADEGAAVVSLVEGIDTATPVGRLTRTLLAAIAEFERDRMAERVSEVTEARARQGGWHGGPRPFGYDYAPAGGLVENPAEATTVRRIFAEYVAGTSQRQIARDLNADGVKPLRANEWVQGTLAKLLANPVYSGQVHLKGTTYGGRHEPIVSDDVWRKAEQLRDATARSNGGRGRTPTANHVLAGGLLRCRCGSAMGATTKKTRTPGVLYEVYVCSGRAQHGLDYCSQKPVQRGPIDNAVWTFFQKVALDIDATKAALAEQHDSKTAELAALRAQADREAQKTADALARIERDYRDEKLTADQWSRLEIKLTAELRAAQAQVDRLDRQRVTLGDDLAQVDAETKVLEQLAALRASVVGEARDGAREGIDAFRAALRRLFSHFDLIVGCSFPSGSPPADTVGWPHPDLTLTGDDVLTLYPHVRVDAIEGWGDGEFPALRKAALALSGTDHNALPT